MDNFCLDSLPSVNFSNRKSLPDAYAVYLVLSKTNEVLYVGRTRHLHRRWHSTNHHLIPLLEKMKGTFIKWIEFEKPFGLGIAESFLIKKYQPRLNGKMIDILIETYRKESSNVPTLHQK
jgi:excinuclease UvrABC nuclease subunit